ncbi:MAG: tyrosine-type recombinase/integrase, partial [Methanothrix sp.]|nr:tyrosine-type recombinase/integrase [Methanothrix sp.]
LESELLHGSRSQTVVGSGVRCYNSLPERQRSSVVEQRFRKPRSAFNLLNKLTVSELAELSKFSKAYISQVRNSKRPPSHKLLSLLEEYSRPQKPDRDYYQLFMQSRLSKEVSPTTIRFYEVKLGRFLSEVEVDRAKQHHIEKFLLQFKNPGNRQRYFQVIKTFYIWREQMFGLPSPIKNMAAPKVGKLILPSLSKEQVTTLIQNVDGLREKAIISVLTESGLRLSELAGIEAGDIDWERHTIRVIGKGKKEAYAPFGVQSEGYLRAWLSEFEPNGGNIWGLTEWGITSLFRRLKAKTGLPCNPHTFRRTFACLLRKAGVDSMTIKDLGRWESLEMVQRYTRSVTFEDSLKFYKAPLS